MTATRRFLTGFGLVLTLGLAACGGSSSPPTSSVQGATTGSAGVNLGTAAKQVSATDALAFTPASQTAHAGDIVQWNNTGTVTHTVTFDSNSSFSDLSLGAGGTWQVRFATAGTYSYHCTIHANMNGTIVVS